MALPSSPPLLPEPDLPTSPGLPPIASNAGVPIGPLTRKRQLSDYGGWSSDPLFSDTTDGEGSQDAGDDGRPRRKRLVRGPWWSLRRRGGTGLRRDMAKDGLRNADSGVWMGSDLSVESVEGVESVESVDGLGASQRRMRDLAVEDTADGDDGTEGTEQIGLDSASLAPRIIQRCVDDGKEAVDLSDIGLTEISSATLRPLHQLIRQTFSDLTRPPSEDEFIPLTPNIQLFLSRNQLTSLPTELFNLTNVAVLSLRNNNLGELPSAIGRLQKLKELNVAGNNIRYLPWEFLDLLNCRGKHREVTIRPNPLAEPCDLSGPSPLPRSNFTKTVNGEELGRWADSRETYERLRQSAAAEADGGLTLRAELELRLKLGRMLRIQYLQEVSRAGRELKLCREELIYLASSAVRYFAVDGTMLRRPGSRSPDPDDFSATLSPRANAPSASADATAPSLFELTLRRLQSAANLQQDFLPFLSDAGISSTLASAIHQAAANTAEHGNDTCSTCGRTFVIARAEWVEYWFHGFSSQSELTPETVLPFMRRVCSWACARPSEMGEFRS